MGLKLGVLLIHGVGSQQADYADDMIDELKKLVRRLGSDDKEVAFEPVWWAPVLAKREADLLRYLADGNDLDWMAVRRFVVQSLADAIAYQGSYQQVSKDQLKVYRDIHAVVTESVSRLRARLTAERDPALPEPPLVVLAHSLGCHVISNHIWDVRDGKPKHPPATAFERFETLAALVTFGCNIPLFTLAFEKLQPIAFPTRGLAAFFPPGTSPGELGAVQQWLNFYDPDDVLGYPLRPLGPEYAKAVREDVAVNVGGLLKSWNPTSHTAYWTDDDVTKPVAKLLHRILGLL